MSHLFSGQFNNPGNPRIRSPCSSVTNVGVQIQYHLTALASRSFHFPLLPVLEKTSESWNNPQTLGTVSSLLPFEFAGPE